MFRQGLELQQAQRLPLFFNNLVHFFHIGIPVMRSGARPLPFNTKHTCAMTPPGMQYAGFLKNRLTRTTAVYDVEESMCLS